MPVAQQRVRKGETRTGQKSSTLGREAAELSTKQGCWSNRSRKLEASVSGNALKGRAKAWEPMSMKAQRSGKPIRPNRPSDLGLRVSARLNEVSSRRWRLICAASADLMSLGETPSRNPLSVMENGQPAGNTASTRSPPGTRAAVSGSSCGECCH